MGSCRKCQQNPRIAWNYSLEPSLLHPSPPQKKNILPILEKKILKPRYRTFLVNSSFLELFSNFTWNLKFVSNISSMIVSENSFLPLSQTFSNFSRMFKFGIERLSWVLPDVLFQKDKMPFIKSIIKFYRQY